MGMYTGLRCKVIIKPEYREEMKRMDDIDYEWGESDLDFLKEFYETFSRAMLIPCGALAYMPDSWEGSPYNSYGIGVPTDGFDRNFDYETGLWTFQCSLKNYENEIEYFIKNILTQIVEKVIHLEYYYEEWSNSVMYDIVDGKIIYIGKGFDYVD